MAGRKSLRDEVLQSNVINLSWTTVSRALNSKNFTEKEKTSIALEIVKKTCPQKLDFGKETQSTLAAVFGGLIK